MFCLHYIMNRLNFRNSSVQSSGSNISAILFYFSTLVLCFHLPLSFARDTITLHHSIPDQRGETLVSPQERFELGFFTPDGSSDHRRYVGIWYYGSSPKTVVWVANRDNPLNDSTGVFGIGQDGNLMLSDGNKQSHWSTGLEGLISSTVTATLLESGNLVLRNNDENGGMSRVLWNSFDHPTDTFLPGMKMNENLKLVSWKTHSDPAKGAFQFEQNPEKENQYKIMKESSNLYWKSGISGNFIDSDNIPTVISSLLSNLSKYNFRKGSKHREIAKYPVLDNYAVRRLVMNFDGKLHYFITDNDTSITSWSLLWVEPLDNCSVYRACGVSSSCSSDSNGLLCSCLSGFEPKMPKSWASLDFSEGCKRRIPLCSNGNNKTGDFVKLKVRRVEEPNDHISVENENGCMKVCLSTCKCLAYSYTETQLRGLKGNATCWIWSKDLNSIQKGHNDEGHEINFHMLRSDIVAGVAGSGQVRVIHGRKKRWPMFVAVIIVSVTIPLFLTVYVYLRRRKANGQDHVENTRGNVALRLHDGRGHAQDLIEASQYEEQNERRMDVHFFDFDSILVATDNFSEANRLGKGGFGPVYKGKFSSGQEIAVKRLSSISGQGQEEFKNEVVLIARLQHRNLVKLLGYCIEGDEKILLYEYMPNRSLDSIIFDPKYGALLDWEMRFNIILGIARGLMYLHQDSRLRIIHRDLKTSNILLDGEMNPKISDFGLARIFEGKQTEGVTQRVVGTYGYMSPEYAMDGFFSTKSDVFSFGVVVLEIISGKKNTGFYDSEAALSLLAYAWRLWQDDNALEMMDENLRGSSKTKEILKCINIGFLCVQEDPDDRPTMSEVVIVLSSETADIPRPKQPAFVVKRRLYASSSSWSKPESHAQLTCTLEGR